jgi:hypothetical protein
MTRREKSSSTPHQYPHLKWVELYFDRRALVQNRFELRVASHRAVVSTRGDPILALSLCLLHRARFAHSIAFAFGEVLHFELSWNCLAAVAAAPCDLLQARFTTGSVQSRQAKNGIEKVAMFESDQWSLICPKPPSCREGFWDVACPFVHKPEFQRWIELGISGSGGSGKSGSLRCLAAGSCSLAGRWLW